MGRAKKTVKVQVSKATRAQWRDRAASEGISVSSLIQRAMAQYLINSAMPTADLQEHDVLQTSGVSAADYARILARIERIEAHLFLSAVSDAVAPSPQVDPDDEDWADLDEPDEILYDFLEPPQSSR